MATLPQQATHSPRSSAFNWRDYIVFGTTERLSAGEPFKYNSEELAQLEKILDAIAATGADGQKLIMDAAKRQPDGKLTIAPSTENSFEIRVREDGRVSFRGDLATHVVYKTSNGYEHASLTGVLVHELVHAGHAATNPLLKNYKDNDLPGISREKLYNFLKNLPYRDVEEIDIEEPVRTKLLSELQHAGVIHIYPDGEMENGEEALATLISDKFMARHFIGEPLRGRYSNAFLTHTMTVEDKDEFVAFKPNYPDDDQNYVVKAIPNHRTEPPLMRHGHYFDAIQQDTHAALNTFKSCLTENVSQGCTTSPHAPPLPTSGIPRDRYAGIT